MIIANFYTNYSSFLSQLISIYNRWGPSRHHWLHLCPWPSSLAQYFISLDRLPLYQLCFWSINFRKLCPLCRALLLKYFRYFLLMSQNTPCHALTQFSGLRFYWHIVDPQDQVYYQQVLLQYWRQHACKCYSSRFSRFRKTLS